jgi:simple sugar transport system permease protein
MKTHFPIWNELKPYVLALIIAFGITAILIGLLGYNIPKALQTLLIRPFASRLGRIETLKKFIPLILTSYAFAIPFKIKFFNIGAWGQMLVGGMGAAIGGLLLEDVNLSMGFFIPLLLLVAMVIGALWALIGAILKAYYNINPIISTIMLNFIGVYWVNFLATSPRWKAELSGHPMTRKLPETAFLPEITRGLHGGIIVIIGVVVFVYVLMNKTVWGYEMNAIGHNPNAAAIYGIPLEHPVMRAFLIGGALAGLAGGIEVLGVHHRLIEGFARTGGAQYGIFGILAALLCRGNPLGVPIAAFFLSTLLVGADAMQRTLEVPV